MTCMGGAVPHCYLLLVFLGQLELCPLAFLGLGVQGPPALTSCCLLTLEALQSRLNPSVGSGPLMVTVYSCAPVAPQPHPAHLPSVCEINLVFVPVHEASVGPLRHLSQRKSRACAPLVNFYLYTISALGSAGSWVGGEGARLTVLLLMPVC